MDINESIAVFAVAATVILSFIYFLVLEKLKSGRYEPDRIILISRYIWRKASGFFILGGIPAILSWIFFKGNVRMADLVNGISLSHWTWITCASVLLILLNRISSRNTGLQDRYPEMRIREWGIAEISLDAGGWVLYLGGYEFLFRGLLLFSCLNAFGLWPAVVINLALYSTLHLSKGMKESIAAIPFGALLCYLTLESNSILPAIFLHAVQAISCDIFCIIRNPEMRFKCSNSKKS